MRILYHSAMPWASTGYARVTREVAPRLHNSGHEVALQSMTSLSGGTFDWHGESLYYDIESPMTIYPNEPSDAQNVLGLTMVEDNFNKFDADIYFTHFDTWTERARKVIREMDVSYASYIIVDHYPVPDEVIEQVMGAHRVITMSKYAKEQLDSEGIANVCIPHGINRDRYYSFDDSFIEDMQIESKNADGDVRTIDVSDRFIVGIVAANHGDRKNIPNQFRAFKHFIDTVDDEAILYVHTDINAKQGFDLNRVRNTIGIPDENIIFTRNEDYGEVEDDYLNSLYNSFDVFLNCSIGESWGLTITEAQAAGTPCIVTNFSSMPEQLGADPTMEKWKQTTDEMMMSQYESYEVAPHGLLVNSRMPVWRGRVSSRQFMAHPRDIYNALKRYYYDGDLRREHGQLAEEYVRSNYTWENHVVPQFRELFDDLESVMV